MGSFLKTDYKYLLILAAMAVMHILLGYFIPREWTIPLFIVFGILFILYYLVFRVQISERQFLFLVVGSVMLRLIWLFAFPNLSDDYARFVWDGRLTAAGYNALKYLPSEITKSGLPGFRPDAGLYRALNSQTYYTCYPPILQGIFAIAAYISPHSIYGNVLILRLFNLVADIGTILLLIRLCSRWNVDKRKVLIYALNPMVIAELTGNLHYEGVMIFFLIAAYYYCWDKDKFWLSILLFACSVITKLVPLVLLPIAFFYWKGLKGFIFALSVLLLTAVSFLPFIDSTIIQKFWSSINSYFQESEFNASIYYLVRDSVQHFTKENNIEVIGPALALFSGTLIAAYAIWRRQKMDIESVLKYASWSLFIYYAFTTTVFPWYITPLIALAVFTGYKFPLIWSATVLFSYYADRDSSFEESGALLWVEYIALFLAFIWDIQSERWNRRYSEIQNHWT